MQEFSIVVVFPEKMDCSADYLSGLISFALIDARVIIRYNVFEIAKGMLKIEGALLLDGDKNLTKETLVALIGQPAKNVTLAVL